MVNNLLFKPMHMGSKELYDNLPGHNLADFTVTKHFINNSSEEVHVTFRNNLTYPVKKAMDSSYPTGEFIVRTCWSFQTQRAVLATRESIRRTMTNLKLKTDELDTILMRLNETVAKFRHSGHVNIMFDRIINARLIVEHGITYLNDDDILLCAAAQAHKIAHPYNSQGVTDPSHYAYVSENGVSGFFVELVDNDKTVDSRFMYVGKKLIEVPAVTDPHRESGVYYSHAVNHRISGSDIEKQYSTLEEAEEAVGLYKTKEEAVSGGDPEIVSKTEADKAKKDLLKKVAELENIRIQLENSKIETERVKIESTLLKESLEKEKALRTNEAEQRKETIDMRKVERADHYEKRSQERKDGGELLKVFGALVVGGLTVFGYMRKK